MSCNGCRVLRKGCSDSCLLRPCLQWIDTAEAQGHATIFVAKFFGRAGLMNFISNVPDSERASLFRSLLFEACGRTINPVNGAVGLLATGNWGLCQAAVDTVLRGGTLRVLQDINNHRGLRDVTKRGRTAEEDDDSDMVEKLDLCLGGGEEGMRRRRRRAATPSEESEMTSDESGGGRHPRLLNLFV